MRVLWRSAAALIVLIWGAGAVLTDGAQAETWPERTVRIILPLPPGGPTDVAARRLAEKLAERWRQPVIVENKQGADGIVAVTSLLSASDGHTLLFSFAGIVSINPYLHDKLPYDPAADLVPIAPVLDNFIAFAASASLGVNSLSELVDYARANPGKLSWSALPGIPNYAFLALLRSQKIDAVRVGYRDFSPAYQDLHQGRLHVIVAGVTNFMGHRDNGSAKILAVVNRERSGIAPEVPTVLEAGFPELAFDGPVGLYGPRGMSAAVVERVSMDVQEIVAQEEFRQKLVSSGAAPRSGTPADFAALIAEQRAKIAVLHQSATRKD
jgi:tripartite-type tricarboxylate transporter receptor subunit TctC